MMSVLLSCGRVPVCPKAQRCGEDCCGNDTPYCKVNDFDFPNTKCVECLSDMDCGRREFCKRQKGRCRCELSCVLLLCCMSNRKCDKQLVLSIGVLKSRAVSIAVGRQTWQTGVGWGGHSRRAVDGNRNSRWNGRSCTHTNLRYQPYWVVDLGRRRRVTAVSITNRRDCCRKFMDVFKSTT